MTGKIITIWTTLLVGLFLCWTFGNPWLALGILLMSVSTAVQSRNEHNN